MPNALTLTQEGTVINWAANLVVPCAGGPQTDQGGRETGEPGGGAHHGAQAGLQVEAGKI